MVVPPTVSSSELTFLCPKAAVKERKESLRPRRATFGRHRRPQTPVDPDVVLPLNRGQQNSLTGEIIKVSAANFVPKRDPFLFSPPLSHFSQSLPTLVDLLVRKGNTVQEARGGGVFPCHPVIAICGME